MARRVVMTTAGVVLAVVTGVLAYRARHFLLPPDDRRAVQPDDRASILPAGPPIRFLSPQPIGKSFTAKERPLVAHVTTVDLDRDGLMDIVACDVAANQVVWIRQFPKGTLRKRRSAPGQAPAHAEPVDLDGDGDLDLVVASLGVMFRATRKWIGGRVENAATAVHQPGDHRQIARSDVRAGDFDGTKISTSPRAVRLHDGETRWMENLGNWRFGSTGPEPVRTDQRGSVDLDGDGDLDIASLVSQEWEEVYGFINDGGHFEPMLI